MANPVVTQTRASVFPTRNTVARPSDYRAGYATRRDRFDLRSQQRWGNWGILEFPTAWLWLEEVDEIALAEETGLLPLPIIDLWP